MISDALGESDSYKPKSLMDGLLHIYGSNKYGYGFEDPKMNQCPLNGSAFPLNSQITEFSAKQIIDEFQIENNSFNLNKNYDRFPQLAMIKEAGKFSPGFQEKFEKYIKAYDSKKNNAKAYFSNFFSDDNKRILGKGVAHRCEQTRASLSSFVCHPIGKMTSEDSKVSSKLFGGYDPEIEFHEQDEDVREIKPDNIAYKAYALLCEGRASIKENSIKTLSAQPSLSKNARNEVDCLKLEDHNVDNWYRCFNEGVKVESSNVAASDSIKNFCERYSCKSPDVIETKSCHTGGPLSSKDLTDLNLKEADIFNQISYLQNLERQSKIRVQYQSDTSTPADDNKTPEAKKSLSDFDLNAFGANGVIKFAGIPANVATIALVNQEMKDKGITPSTPEQIRQVVNRSEISNENLASNSIPNIATTMPANNELSTSPRNNSWKNPENDNEVASVSSTKANNRTEEAPSGKTDEDREMVKDLEQIMKN